MRSEGYCSWVVCLSVSQHLTSGASVRLENAFTYSTGDEGQKICGVFSETAPLQRSSTPSVVRPCVQSAIFPAEITHAHYSIYCVRFLDISITRALSTTLVALYLKTWFSYRDTAPRVQHFSAFHYIMTATVLHIVIGVIIIMLVMVIIMGSIYIQLLHLV